MRQAVGVAVFFGMLGVTLFGLIFTPIFYMIVRNLADRQSSRERSARQPAWIAKRQSCTSCCRAPRSRILLADLK